MPAAAAVAAAASASGCASLSCSLSCLASYSPGLSPGCSLSAGFTTPQALTSKQPAGQISPLCCSIPLGSDSPILGNGDLFTCLGPAHSRCLLVSRWQCCTCDIISNWMLQRHRPLRGANKRLIGHSRGFTNHGMLVMLMSNAGGSRVFMLFDCVCMIWFHAST